MVAHVPDSVAATNLPLKVNAFYQPVQWLFNYPLTALIVAFVLLLGIITWISFGKRIIRYFQVRKLKRGFERFVNSFSSVLDDLKGQYSIGKAETAISLWKNYLEKLEGQPYTKFTSREINALITNSPIRDSLVQIDRMIYGGIPPSSMDAFFELKSFSEDRYFKKLDEFRSNKK